MSKQPIIKWFATIYGIAGAILALGAFILVRVSQQETTQHIEQTSVATAPPVKPNTPVFPTLHPYAMLLGEPATAIRYYISQAPKGFTRVQIGNAQNGVIINIEGFDKPVYVLVPQNWEAVNAPEIQQFYLEIVGSIECLIDPECPNPNETFWYGPFQGNLQELLK